MDLIRVLLPVMRVRFPGWKLRRWVRNFWRFVLELLAIIGLAALATGLIYYMLFIR